MYSKIALSACLRLSHDRRQISLALMVLKKVSAAALSQQLPLPLIDTLKSCWRGIIVRTVLAAAIRVMHAAFGRLPECDGHLQCPDRQVASHAITDGPADDTTRVQVQDHSQMQPPAYA
jgi:hypothetical protein